MKRDLLLALRSLRKSPLTTIAVVLSLALGIGANTAIFSIMDQMLLQTLPVEGPDRLVFLDGVHPRSGSVSAGSDGGSSSVFTYPMMRDLIDQQTALASVAGFRELGGNLAIRGNSQSGFLNMVSGNYFETLGVRQGLGRLFTLDDDKARRPVAVLSYRYWQNELGADPSVINESIVVNGSSLTIVGIAPRGFNGTRVGNSPDIWVPISLRKQLYRTWNDEANRRSWWVYMVGRLKDGQSIEQAQPGLQSLFSSILAQEAKDLTDSDQAFRDRYAQGTIQLVSGAQGRSSSRQGMTTAFTAMMLTTLMVLLIACANVANLQLVRATGRAKDIAVRVALGSGRWAIFREMLTESVLLGMLGSLGGVLVARAVVELLLRTMIPPQTPAGIITGELDTSVLLLTVLLGVLTGIGFGIYPAISASRIAVSDKLKDQSGQVQSAGGSRVRKGLVMAQMALSLTLLVLAGLMARSVVKLSTVDVGFAPENLIVFGVSPHLNGYDQPSSRTFLNRTVEELSEIPGVTSVSVSEVPFIGSSRWQGNITVEGHTKQQGEEDPSLASVGADIFRTMGVKLKAGREFRAGDGPGAPQVVIVNEQFERMYFNGQSALGRRMAFGEGEGVTPNREIVGVIHDMKYHNVRDATPIVVYTPLAQTEQLRDFFVYVRTALPPETTLANIRQSLTGLDANLPLYRLRTMSEQVRLSTHEDKAMAQLSASFALLATLLAIIGLYGVMSYSVASRTREIGLRMAFGAGVWRIQKMVLRETGKILAVGAVLGLVAAYWLSSYVQSLLFEVQAHDVLVYTAALALVASAGIAAALVPARRAARVDPMTCLRYE